LSFYWLPCSNTLPCSYEHSWSKGATRIEHEECSAGGAGQHTRQVGETRAAAERASAAPELLEALQGAARGLVEAASELREALPALNARVDAVEKAVAEPENRPLTVATAAARAAVAAELAGALVLATDDASPAASVEAGPASNMPLDTPAIELFRRFQETDAAADQPSRTLRQLAQVGGQVLQMAMTEADRVEEELLSQIRKEQEARTQMVIQHAIAAERELSSRAAPINSRRGRFLLVQRWRNLFVPDGLNYIGLEEYGIPIVVWQESLLNWSSPDSPLCTNPAAAKLEKALELWKFKSPRCAYGLLLAHYHIASHAFLRREAGDTYEQLRKAAGGSSDSPLEQAIRLTELMARVGVPTLIPTLLTIFRDKSLREKRDLLLLPLRNQGVSCDLETLRNLETKYREAGCVVVGLDEAE